MTTKESMIQTARETLMYGMTRKEVIDYLTPQAQMVGNRMLVLSILSDAQELIARNQNEEARQLLNRVKLFVSVNNVLTISL